MATARSAAGRGGDERGRRRATAISRRRGSVRWIAAVFDGDGDAANTFRALPDFPFDFFDSTDQWYELEFTQSDTRRVEKTIARNGVFLNDLATGAVVMVAGDAVYFIPQDEFSVPMGGELGFRVTAFRTRARARWRPRTRGRPPATCIRAWGSRWRHWRCPGAGGPPRPRLPRPEGPA